MPERPPYGSAEASGDRSIAAVQSIRQALSGDGAVAMYAETSLTLPAEAYQFPAVVPKLVNLPEKTGSFVGRERELALLEAAFGDPGGVVVHAVHGLGGIGKSTLAAHWAAGRVGDFNPVWWISAESPADVDAGIAALGRALLPALVGVLPAEALRERTVQWLASHDGWLLVLDNVSDPADIKPLLARAPGGRFLITTRRGATSWRGLAEPLDLDVLGPAEAVELFTKIYQGHDSHDPGVLELCAELGRLPLAIDQAAAYCREAGITPREYLALLADYPADMYAAGAEGGDAQRTTARVWNVTLKRLADHRQARNILAVTAWWAPDAIPRSYLAPLGTPPQITEAIRRLAAHSMITLHGDTISVHRLVQAVARTPAADALPQSRQLIWQEREMAALLLETVSLKLASDRGTEGPGRVWATHVEALATRSVPEWDTERDVELYGLAASGYLVDGHPVRAVALAERALSAAVRVLAADDPMTSVSRGVLAGCLQMAGEQERALALYTQVLVDAERALGPEHPDTFEVRGQLAQALAWAGESERALTLAHENAQVAARVLGGSHPTTQDARSVLEELRRDADTRTDTEPEPDAEARVREVEDQLARAVAESGESDAAVADLRMELLFAHHDAGHRAETVRAAEAAVAAFRRRYGDTSILTLYARAMHVAFLYWAGDKARARALAPDVEADIERALGSTPQAQHLLSLLSRLFTGESG